MRGLKLEKNWGTIRKRMDFFSQRVVNEWNGLPEEVVSVKKMNSFKSAIDRHWANHPLKFNYEAASNGFQCILHILLR